MAEIKIPISAGTFLIFIGAVILVGSIAALLVTVPQLGTGFSPNTNFSLISAQIQLSWFFIFFAAFIIIIMGIRRVSPA